MAFKSAIICASALIVQITGQCIGNAFNTGFMGNGLIDGIGLAGNSLGLGSNGFAGYAGYGNGPASSGGGFAVTSSSPISPTGVSVLAENLAIEGPLAIGGQLPFLGTVAMEGALPAAGVGAVTYGCGNGNIGITSEGLAGPATVGPYGAGLPAAPSFGNGLGAGLGFNGLGFASPGIGCGGLY